MINLLVVLTLGAPTLILDTWPILEVCSIRMTCLNRVGGGSRKMPTWCCFLVTPVSKNVMQNLYLRFFIVFQPTDLIKMFCPHTCKPRCLYRRDCCWWEWDSSGCWRQASPPHKDCLHWIMYFLFCVRSRSRSELGEIKCILSKSGSTPAPWLSLKDSLQDPSGSVWSKVQMLHWGASL